jgi:hypothetical protein
MVFRRGSNGKEDELKGKTLARQANQYDLEPEFDLGSRGVSAPHDALKLVASGFDLLLRMTEADAFPSDDRGTRKRGEKLVRRDIVFGGGSASVFLAQALPLLLAKLDGRLSERSQPPRGLEDPQVHLELARMVGGYFQMFRGKKVLPSRKALAWPLKAFKAVPSEEEEAELDDLPDVELTPENRDYARDLFINRATIEGIRQSLEAAKRSSDYWSIDPDILDISTLDPDDPKVVEQRQRSLLAWEEGSRSYMAYAALMAPEVARR